MRTKYLRAGEMDDHHDDMDAEDEEESILRLVDGDGDASTDEEASDDEQSGEEEDGGAHARGDTDPEDPQLARGHGASGPKTKPGAGKSQTSRPREPTRNPVRKYSKNTAKKRTNGTRAILDTSYSTDCKYDVLGGYVPSFIAHLKEARARVGVGAGPEASEEEDVSGREAAGSIPTSPDTVSPDACTLSHWTSTEQTAFFRALSVYSRWRPDLVASCVPTKSVWEVGMYLEALEEGAARLATEEGEEGEEGEDKDQGSRRRRSRGVVERNGKGKKKGQADGDRDEDTDMGGSSSSSSSDTDEDTHLSPGLDSYRSYEPAHEVSQDWIDAEEVMASWVIHEDYLASLEKPAGSDAEQGEGGEHELPKRKRGRPRGSGKGRGRGRPRTSGKSEADSRSQSASRSVHHSQSPKPTYHSSANPRSLSSSRKRALIPSDSPTRKRLKVEHRREVLMGHLEAAHLLVLDGISREGKETTRGRNKGKEDSVAEVSTYAVECRKEGELGAGAVVGMGASGEKQVQQGNGERTVNGLSNTENPPNAMIDPVLLALSGGRFRLSSMFSGILHLYSLISLRSDE
ncbi:hypothetical protein BS17DRAFT_187830 [Gyrodon lividus]|nr:hypothetical protein BS17DRAFT_187830 [Gyrodon lividus]